MNNKEKKWARRYRMVVLKVFIETSFKKWHTLQVLNNKSNWSSSWLWKMNYVKANGSRHRCLMLRGESCATVSEYQHGYNVVLKGNRVRKKWWGRQSDALCAVAGYAVSLSARWKWKSQEAFKEVTYLSSCF